MTADSARFRIRTAPFAGHASDPAPWLLDWAPGTSAETIEFTPGFFAGWQPGTAGSELLRFAAGVYCADRVVLRRTRPDAWTRDLSIDVPVTDPGAWRQAPWQAALGFLTGDRWTLQPHRASPASPPAPAGLPVDAVSLFSAASTRCAESSISSNATQACGSSSSGTTKEGKPPPLSRPSTPGWPTYTVPSA